MKPAPSAMDHVNRARLDTGRDSGFVRIGGHCALDFTNTVNWTADGPVEEHLATFAELADWGELAGIVPADQRWALVRAAGADPVTAAGALAEARAVRATMHRLLAKVAAHKSIDADILRLFNRTLSTAIQSLDLAVVDGGGGFAWRPQDGAALGAITAQVLRSAGELLTSPDLARVRCCANNCCGWLFLDTSRSGRRRWCSMDRCGSRAKARRYYHRTRDARDGQSAGEASGTRTLMQRMEREGDATGSP